MLTRRENLLIRPWQQRRFQNHRRKVQSALPAIDASAPKSRAHVTCKLKKVQSEGERIERIEHDNVRLLQRMAAIMRTSRLDNRWLTDPPGGFLGRIGMYVPVTAPTSRRMSLQRADESQKEEISEGRGRKATCPACKLRLKQEEERQGLPAIESASRQSTKEEKILTASPSAEGSSENKPKKKKKKKTWQSAEYHTREVKRPDWNIASSKLVLTRGQLTVSVSFPSHTGVTLQRAGCNPSILEAEFCMCNSLRKISA